MAISLQYWVNYTTNNTKLQRKSENAVACNHVLKFTFDHSLIVAVIQASMRDRSYKVNVQLAEDNNIQSSSCECANGLYECHHVAAALLYGYKHVSKTDIPQTWLKCPKSRIPKETKTIGELFPERKSYRSLNRPVDDSDREFLYSELCGLGTYTAMKWFLSPEPPAVKCPIQLVEDLLICEQFTSAFGNKYEWLKIALKISSDDIPQIAEMTKGQRENPMWCAIRKLRFTASNFGQILRAVKKNSIAASLKKSLLSSYKLDNVAAINWGVTHEATAIAVYCTFGAVISETGIWLHQSGVLAASPDGLVVTAPGHTLPLHYQNEDSVCFDPDIIEVKCPFSARDLILKDAKLDFLECHDDRFRLKATHNYYHQIQGQLHILDKYCCDLIVWTLKDVQVIRICRDEQWRDNITKLITFYFDVFIPSL